MELKQRSLMKNNFGRFFALALTLSVTGSPLMSVARADMGPDESEKSERSVSTASDKWHSTSELAGPAQTAAPDQSLGQFPKPEIAAAGTTRALENPSGINFPKVKTREEEQLAKRFSWWPTDAKPAPVKDPDRRGYWWWPDQPGQQRPWGNQGFVYVVKIIFDYKSAEGEMKPSLIVKRIIKNVKIYFDYNKSDLREDGIDALDKASYTLEHNPKAEILITGNCDLRGSEQYNQKLGESRALGVRDYMLKKGLPEARIRILSRGKLDAMAPGNDIVGMQKDRNAQFVIAEVEEIMIPASQANLYQDKVIEEKKVLEGQVKVEVKEYVIQKGDTLWAIAKEQYGDGKQWKRIYEFNKDVISNPDKPKKGTKIRIPIE